MAFYEFTYPPQADGINAALEDLNKCLTEHKVDARQGGQILAVVSEALSNAVCHGQTDEKTNLIRVSLRVSDSPAPVEVLDQATGGIRLIQNVNLSRVPDDANDADGTPKQYATSVRFAKDKDDGLHLVISLKQRGNAVYGDM